MVSEARRAEFDQIRSSVTSWAMAEPSIVGVALIGSWARGEATIDSDADILILATDIEQFVQSTAWLELALSQPAEIVRTQCWGALTERRTKVASGFEIEFGFVDPAWASTEPVDPGTQRVVSDGCAALYDDHRLLIEVIKEVSGKGSS